MNAYEMSQRRCNQIKVNFYYECVNHQIGKRLVRYEIIKPLNAGEISHLAKLLKKIVIGITLNKLQSRLYLAHNI